MIRILLILTFAITFFACSRQYSASGTGNDHIDAELREVQFHEKQLELLAIEIDSLEKKKPRSADENQKLNKAMERRSWHEARRADAIQTANELGVKWNYLYQETSINEKDRRSRDK